MSRVDVGTVGFGDGCSLGFIAGPCVIESRDHSLKLAAALARVFRTKEIPWIFKASFDKANRSSLGSFRGPGLDEGLDILAEVRRETGVPVLSDIHETSQARPAGEVLDCIQIPAFLCRQTDLLVASAATGRPVNVKKKGQFMSPEEMEHVAGKLTESGCRQVLLTERGTFFGYSRLVNDMTAMVRMRKWGPVIYDATHSCQLPGAGGGISGGQRQFLPVLSSAGVAAGADGVFMEVHDDPDQALSDPATVYPLAELPALLDRLTRVHQAVR